jgi:cyanophycinase-like exopeptidase
VSTPGKIALVGSGEFLPVMEDVDRLLLEGRPGRVVVLPTAAAPEGAERIEYWAQLALDHYARIGVEAEPLLVLDRHDAERPDLAARIEGAGLVYLSGGDPTYLADTLRDSVVWRAIASAWESGTALAGCSAGAIALSAVVRDRWTTEAPPRPALGVVRNLAVLPHFDRVRQRWPQFIESRSRGLPDGVTAVGVDEDTAIVATPERSGGAKSSVGPWTVMGRQRAWVLREGAEPLAFDAGSVVDV